MRQFYEAAAYDPAWPASHWAGTVPLQTLAPLQGAARAEVAVIGAGYAGLNAALVLARGHGVDVAVLEAAQPGWGASGRNGGFCCLGGAKLADAGIVARHGVQGARDWRGFQRRAIDHVAGLLEAEGIDARQGPEGEALLAHSPAAYGAMRAGAEAEAALHGSAPRLIPAGALAEHGLAGPGFFGAALGGEGFPLNPMRYVQGLARAAGAGGARIYGRSPVTRLEPVQGGWRLTTPGGSLIAAKVLIAGNGYAPEDLQPWLSGRTLPVFSAILVTRPLSAEERAAQGFTSPLMAYDSRHLLHYFRHLPDGRFLFGMRGGLSARPKAEAETLARLRKHFEALFPAWKRAQTETAWSGLACLTGSLAPYIGPVPGAPGLFAAFGWHGNGVAAASLGGAEAARLIAGAPTSLPALITTPPRRFPFPRLRRLALRAAYAGYALRDGPLPR
ncbi:FAD-binding oxidoreductase [Frigidibacter sp.]|uniref:NAD(P)/FAD-dependent oxidoreductase n=1 Tax=Frigidibacter sp. TaxID=2586418 RepID=UPI0027356359|nr:FAD-dependent oxidoreductase [Frigidibacter sp.]MDP3339804.1 FAD-dependent oxidoreductase [Frigidibacter sp.]